MMQNRKCLIYNLKKMNIINRIIFTIIAVFSILGANSVSAADLEVYFFWSQGCPHCAKQEEFFESIKDEYPGMRINDYEVGRHRNNAELLQKVGKELNANVAGVPFTVIGDKYFIGFNESSSKKELKSRIDQCIFGGCPDSVADIVGLSSKAGEDPKQIITPGKENEGKKLAVPFLGEIDIMSVSLPVLTVLIGAIDGFNPCAMWTLLFLITLLLGMEDRRRMWILGSAFIVTSAFVYFIFMVGWLNLIMFLGVNTWIKIAIGLVALIAGGYSLKEYMTNKKGGCKVEKSEKQKAVFNKLKNVTKKENFWVALFGIILLAFAVNLVELMCSAGFPAMYTQVLALSNLQSWQYYMYIGFYVFFFMLDDMIVFFTSMVALELTGITTKFDRASKLIGGILMVIIGLLLIFKPELLMFG